MKILDNSILSNFSAESDLKTILVDCCESALVACLRGISPLLYLLFVRQKRTPALYSEVVSNLLGSLSTVPWRELSVCLALDHWTWLIGWMTNSWVPTGVNIKDAFVPVFVVCLLLWFSDQVCLL